MIRASLAAGLLCLSCLGHTAALPPTFEQVKAGWRSSEAVLLDRHGAPLQELRIDETIRRTDWTRLEDISPAMVDATLLAEDRRFLGHAGVDWLAVGKAALTNWLARRPRGASTISMQVAALIDPAGMPAAGRRDVAEKWRQMRAAGELEKRWSKERILEAYLNLVGFRGDLVGIDAAARALFDKRPAGLGQAESLILAALIRAPGAKPEIVAKRACAMAAAMAGGPACADLTNLARNSLTGRYPIVPAANLASHFAHGPARAWFRQPGQRLTSTLDATVQRLAIDALDEQLRLLAGRNVADAAALVVDNASGEVLAYVGRSTRDSASPHSDGVIARRQAGSTLKPFLYSLALERRYLTAASPLDDSPLTLATPGGGYAPDNYDHRYRGLTSVRNALAGSLNIPAVRTLELVGADLFATRLARLGFTGLDEAGDFYGPSLALGSLDVSLWELVDAYRTLANGGRRGGLVVLPPARPSTDTERVVSREAAFLVADILADREARATTFGLENVLATRYWSAVKTGTSKDMRDNWCVGFSERYTVGVWLGNHSGEPMHDVSGVSGAAPAWRRILDSLHVGTPSRPPRSPERLVRARISPPGEPVRLEWFLAGTEPAGATWQAASPPARIVHPGDGDILALDPDIPAELQRLRPHARQAPEGSRWRLDEVLANDVRENEALVNEVLAGETTDGEEWPLRRGRHVLVLLDKEGKELDRVEFVVR